MNYIDKAITCTKCRKKTHEYEERRKHGGLNVFCKECAKGEKNLD